MLTEQPKLYSYQMVQSISKNSLILFINVIENKNFIIRMLFECVFSLQIGPSKVQVELKLKFVMTC
jgi:hypothetical protein